MFFRKRSFEVLPALSVRGPELRRSLRTVTVAWMFGIVWMTCATGSRTNIFGRMLGFSNTHFSILTAIPFIATFMQLVSTILIERTGLRKYQFLTCGVFHRLLWAPMAMIPLVLPIPSTAAVWLMLGLMMLSQMLNAMATPAWINWMGDLIPRRIRGRYFAMRGIVTNAFRIPIVILLGLYLDWVQKEGVPVTGEAQPLLLYSIMGVFVLAGVMGALDILLFLTLREVKPTVTDGLPKPSVEIRVSPPGAGLGGRMRFFGRYLRSAGEQLLLDPLRDNHFRRYVLFGATATFAMAVAAPFFWRNCLEWLGLSQLATDAIFLIIGPVAAIAAARPVGRLIDRWGRRPVLMLGSALTCLSILPYFFASRHFTTPDWLAGGLNAAIGLVGFEGPVRPETPVIPWMIMALSPTIGAIGWGAVNNAKMNIILGFSDGHGRSRYIAASTVFIALGGALGLLGGVVADRLEFLQEAPIAVGPFEWNNWHATFAMSLLARLTALGLTIHMPDPSSAPARVMFRTISVNAYNYVSSRLFWPLRAFGWGNTPERRRRRRRR